jgi:alpha-L-fucosidase
VAALTQVGQWTGTHGDLIHKADRCQVHSSEMANFTRQGNTLYVHTYYWPGETVAIGGLKAKVLSAKLYPGGEPVKFTQGEWRLRLEGLPAQSPDPIATTIAVECDSEPTQDMQAIRINRKRESV